MTRTVRRTAFLLLVLLVSGCSSSKERLIRKNRMAHIGLAYHNYSAAFGKGPSKADDLVEAIADPQYLDLIRSGEVVLIWDVDIQEIHKTPGALHEIILGYEKVVPEKGGWVMLGDGAMLEMSPEEFKKMPLAKPKGQ